VVAVVPQMITASWQQAAVVAADMLNIAQTFPHIKVKA
jgi:hypothetical protein